MIDASNESNNATGTSSLFEDRRSSLLDGTGNFNDLKNVVKTPDFQEKLKDIDRHTLLPALYKIRGKPYSIKDYPQFEPMYAKDMPANIVYLCGRQIAKSTNLSRSEVLDMIQIPNFQILYVAPLQAQANRYSSLYLHEAMSTCPMIQLLQKPDPALGEGPIIKSVGHKSLVNGAGIQLMYAKTSADRARGITCDRIDYDEIQDQLIDVIPVVAESITNSEYMLQRFTGTAKTTDSAAEYYWQMSSQGEWVVRCLGCNYWNVPTKDGDALNMISVEGPICAKCGKILDTHCGELVHAYPHRKHEWFGVHVPQIVVPAITKSPVKWAKLIQKVSNYPETLIFNEILGISHDAGARLITIEDIKKQCVLGTFEDLRKNLDDYAHVVVGVDWGVAEISSFTVSTVLGYTKNGDIDVLFAKRYMGQDIESVVIDVMRTAIAYDADLIAADFGVGWTNNTMLRNRGMNVSQVAYTRSNDFMRYNEIHGIDRWMVDRNTALSLMFWGIKHGKIKFPNYDVMEPYINDLMSPYESIVESGSGMTSKKFLRNPSAPDDFAHALTFGMVMVMRLAGDSMINIVPEHAMDYVGREFPESSTADMDSIMSALRG